MWFVEVFSPQNTEEKTVGHGMGHTINTPHYAAPYKGKASVPNMSRVQRGPSRQHVGSSLLCLAAPRSGESGNMVRSRSSVLQQAGGESEHLVLIAGGWPETSLG